MGNSSCNPVFDEIALLSRDALNIDRDNRILLLAKLIELLQDQDWDTEDESLADFAGDEAVVEAFRRNGIVIRCGDEGAGNSYCERERGAPGHKDGLHEDESGRKWPVTQRAET
jgi:hypothetical protein